MTGLFSFQFSRSISALQPVYTFFCKQNNDSKVSMKKEQRLIQRCSYSLFVFYLHYRNQSCHVA